MNRAQIYLKAAEATDSDWRSEGRRWHAYACGGIWAACVLEEPTRKAIENLFDVFNDKGVAQGNYLWGDPEEISYEMHNARILGLLFLAEMTK